MLENYLERPLISHQKKKERSSFLHGLQDDRDEWCIDFVPEWWYKGHSSSKDNILFKLVWLLLYIFFTFFGCKNI